ncbi:thioredoxin domain-containing protein [Terriglobus saanensis]|uniref:N-acylglucosamine 2-epimerase n=1 Tax=Terriglobus saanensis (strain ATCC BAA-1853 / DSM 23119 / SP1PR4) TaxID=401053 RepID=E8V7A5_TERSS|nr:thioredoxin domain-containing protein [Terriglobus saanensis]ADV82818.1 N-acylglucosamine 2-epimerase [Terriglobus saanensis SP1PR4]
MSVDYKPDQSTEVLNSLATSASAYLRSAMHQPVQWHEWGDAGFELAVRENKPILLDIGAVWCHWCHVMDRESYENADTADLINRYFIAIKVDRDERPDVDTRYQAAVSAISGQGGWPLTAFLTPEGKPFFGGTYFPPEDRFGRPSFQRVLQTMADAFQDRRSEVEDSADSVMQAIEFNESFSGRSSDLGPDLVNKLAESMLKQFDPQYGGFGSQPKFPHPGALDLLTDIASRGGPLAEQASNVVRVTLDKMALGGMRDQIGGGFHRYSVDERWVVPHFEKMAYDNAELLKSYVRAFRTFLVPEYAEVAREILRWMDGTLSDRERGGFYSSQDADLTLDDDGDYFTWTRDEAAAVLSPEELAVAEIYYDIGEIGDMHHDPSRNVLHVRYTLAEVSRRIGITEEEVQSLLLSLRGKLASARSERAAPFVDRTMYTGWNGLCIAAYLEAGRALHNQETVQFGLRSLDRLLQEAWNEETGLGHVISYADGHVPAQAVAGVLEDYAFAGLACVAAWEVTGESRWLRHAEALAARMIRDFADAVGGGFFDTARGSGVALGALSARRKPLQDSPTPAGNSAAALFLLQLADWTMDEKLQAKAADTLETFAGIVEHFGLYAATFGLALQRLLLPEIQIVVVGEDDSSAVLEAAALAGYSATKSVLRLKRSQLEDLRGPMAETLPHLPAEMFENSFAMVCGDGRCQPPTSDPDVLVREISEIA